MPVAGAKVSCILSLLDFWCHVLDAPLLFDCIFVLFCGYSALSKLGKLGSKIDQHWSVGHRGPDCGAMGGPGGPQGSCFDDFGVSLGCRLGGLWRHILYFLVGYFNAISNMFPEGLFDGSASLLGSFGHPFCDFLVVLGSGENSVPACTGAMF